MRRTGLTLILALAASACGGSTPAAHDGSEGAPGDPTEGPADSAEPSPGDSEAAGGASDAKAKGIPTACADASAEYCTPGDVFAKRLCQEDLPTVALHLFSGQAPFTKAYLARKTKAWSASGAGSSNEQIPAGEEVVVMLHRNPPDLGGMQVSGATGGYEVLRWDGSCVTLQAGELMSQPNGRAKIARIVWKRIEMDTRDALREDSELNEVYLQHKKHCRGVSMGKVSLECVKADEALGQAIAKFVRDGGKLPEPHKLP